MVPVRLIVVSVTVGCLASPAFAQFARSWYQVYPSGVTLDTADYVSTNQLLATDSRGNCYLVAQVARARYDRDIKIIKVSSVGTKMWERWIEGNTPGESRAMALAVDGANNLLVAGFVRNRTSGEDAILAKFSPTGDLLFSRETNGRLGRDDRWLGLVLDAEGRAYVMGYQDETPGLGDWSSTGVVQAFGTTGETLWSQITPDLNKVLVQGRMALRPARTVKELRAVLPGRPAPTRKVPARIAVIRFEGDGNPRLKLTEHELLNGRATSHSYGPRVFNAINRDPAEIVDLGKMFLLSQLHCSPNGEMTLSGNSQFDSRRDRPFVIRFGADNGPKWGLSYEPSNRQDSSTLLGGLVVEPDGGCYLGGVNNPESPFAGGFLCRVSPTGRLVWQVIDPDMGWLRGVVQSGTSGPILAAGRDDSHQGGRLVVKAFARRDGATSLVESLNLSEYTFGSGIRFAGHRTAPAGLAISVDGTLYAFGEYGAPAFGASLLVAYRPRKGGGSP